VVIWKAQVEYDRKFSHHEETKITKQRQNILSFSLRVLRALRGEKCLAWAFCITAFSYKVAGLRLEVGGGSLSDHSSSKKRPSSSFQYRVSSSFFTSSL